jgi:sulfur-oxidizing protein SoxZ
MAVRALIQAPSSARMGDVVQVRTLVQHPMETGYRLDSNGAPMPRDLIRRLEAHFEGELILTADLHAAISANPYFAFHFRLPRSGTLTLRWQGDNGFAHSESLRITAT